MTITDAIAQLTKLWPLDSFSVDVEVWSHCNDGHRDTTTVKWSIYSAERRLHYTADTLADAMKLAAGFGGSLAEVDAATKPVAS